MDYASVDAVEVVLVDAAAHHPEATVVPFGGLRGSAAEDDRCCDRGLENAPRGFLYTEGMTARVTRACITTRTRGTRIFCLIVSRIEGVRGGPDRGPDQRDKVVVQHDRTTDRENDLRDGDRLAGVELDLRETVGRECLAERRRNELRQGAGGSIQFGRSSNSALMRHHGAELTGRPRGDSRILHGNYVLVLFRLRRNRGRSLGVEVKQTTRIIFVLSIAESARRRWYY